MQQHLVCAPPPRLSIAGPHIGALALSASLQTENIKALPLMEQAHTPPNKKNLRSIPTNM
ncbi:hypothetical protein [Sphingobacterium sp. SYP-B4668]|uniref:hypothetical protein n=1 Tax=Sphingobacterium sp. SYP-B4668 TaxID=2996035 RepID=UPI0022DDDFEE|nr:hypothetical protein [Sphingobacterium sp. SYP-B4668]